MDDVTLTETGETTNYTLSVSKVGAGSGTVTGTNINCGSTCSATYTSGTSVTFTANPVNGGTPVYQWKLNGVNVGTSEYSPSGWGSYYHIGRIVQSGEFLKGYINNLQIYYF